MVADSGRVPIDMYGSGSLAATACLAVLALAACGADAGRSSAPPNAARAVESTMPAEGKVVRTDLEGIVEAVTVDAAKRSGVAREDIVVESAESVTWADGSLGCPEPGASYTMALVPGYRVKLLAAGRSLDYHATTRGHFILCPPGRSDTPIAEDAS